MGLSERYALELAEIRGSHVRNWTRMVLDHAPAYQLTCPAGVSQRHHPPDERGEGGQILHVKRVFRVCMAWADDYSMDDIQRDRLLASALLHDIVKYGPADKPTDKLWKPHDENARTFLNQFKISLLWTEFEAICEAIREHMGPWGITKADMGDPVTTGHLLHMADYIASETWFTVDPLPPTTGD